MWYKGPFVTPGASDGRGCVPRGAGRLNHSVARALQRALPWRSHGKTHPSSARAALTAKEPPCLRVGASNQSCGHPKFSSAPTPGGNCSSPTLGSSSSHENFINGMEGASSLGFCVQPRTHLLVSCLLYEMDLSRRAVSWGRSWSPWCSQCGCILPGHGWAPSSTTPVSREQFLG